MPRDARDRAERIKSALQGGLVICAAVYAGLLAHPKARPAFVDAFLERIDVLLDFDLDGAIWCEAGRGLASYARRRQSGGHP